MKFTVKATVSSLFLNAIDHLTLQPFVKTFVECKCGECKKHDAIAVMTKSYFGNYLPILPIANLNENLINFAEESTLQVYFDAVSIEDIQGLLRFLNSTDYVLFIEVMSSEPKNHDLSGAELIKPMAKYFNTFANGATEFAAANFEGVTLAEKHPSEMPQELKDVLNKLMDRMDSPLGVILAKAMTQYKH